MSQVHSLLATLALTVALSGCIPKVKAPVAPAPTPEPAAEIQADAYVVLSIDYRPAMWANLCTLDQCAFDISLEAFQNLCIDSAGGTAELCATYHADINDNGGLDNSQGAADYSSINQAGVGPFQVYRAVLASVLEDYPGLHIGLITPNFPTGGTVLQGYRIMDASGTANQQLADTLNSIPKSASGSSAHPLQLKETYYELYRYLVGGNYINLKNTNKNFSAAAEPRNQGYADYDGCLIAGVSCDALTGTITGGVDSGHYQSPFNGSETCVKLYALITAFSVTNLDNDLDAAITADFSATTASNFTSLLDHFSNSNTDLLPAVTGSQNMKSWVISYDTHSQYTQWATAGRGAPAPLLMSNLAQFESQLRAVFEQIKTDNSGCN